MIEKRKQRLLRLRISCALIGTIVFTLGLLTKDFNFMALGLFAFWSHNICYCFEKLNSFFLLLLFHLTIFTFLLSRPFIGTLRGKEWWHNLEQQPENVMFAIYAVTISLLMLYMGAEIVDRHLFKRQTVERKIVDCNGKRWIEILRAVSMVIFVITMIFFLIQEVEKLVYMIDKTYVIYYTGFQRSLPSLVYFLASFMKYSLCVYLATMPEKKKTFLPLFFFGISALPSLLIGIRNPIMLNVLFIFMYYVVRDILGDKKKWIGRVERIVIIVGTPFVLVFMNIYAYIRSDNSVKTHNPFTLLVDFFYAQGVTFDVLTKGYGYRFNLPERPFRNYTFGGIIDYIHYGTLGQKIFNVEALPSGNNWTNGTVSNSLAHNLSYTMNKEAYYNGNGWGSSYLLESFIDYGYIGIAIFSLVLSVFLVLILKKMGQCVIVDAIFLICLTEIFFIPRAEATGWLTFMITVRFWACIVGCYLGAYICFKSKFLYGLLQRLRLCPRDTN